MNYKDRTILLEDKIKAWYQDCWFLNTREFLELCNLDYVPHNKAILWSSLRHMGYINATVHPRERAYRSTCAWITKERFDSIKRYDRKFYLDKARKKRRRKRILIPGKISGKYKRKKPRD